LTKTRWRVPPEQHQVAAAMRINTIGTAYAASVICGAPLYS
jgi:hypothetical protein